MACGFLDGGAVVNDVNFVHAAARDGNLVEDGVVIDAVAVHPVGPSCGVSGPPRIVDVDQLWMVFHDAVIVLGWIVVLNQVVPCVPSPDDVGAVVTNGLNFHDVVWPNVVLSSG